MDTTDEIVIETIRSSGEPRRTVIWIVTDGADAYVRSVNGRRGRWFQDLQERPEAFITVGAERIPAEAYPATDDATVELVSDLFRAKYGQTSRRSTASMLEPETLDTTLRLDPA